MSEAAQGNAIDLLIGTSIETLQSSQSPRTPSTPGLVQLTSSESEIPTERSHGSPDSTPTKSRSSAERVLEKDRKLHAIESRLFTDNDNFYPFGLHSLDPDYRENLQKTTDGLLKHSIALKIQMIVTETEDSNQLQNAEGQAFLIDTGKGLVMATMKHNFCQEVNKDGKLEQCNDVVVTTPKYHYPFLFDRSLVNWDADQLTAEDAFEPTNWKYGNELEFVAVNQQQDKMSLLKAVDAAHIKAFKAVSTTFEVKEGMQVGILARSCFGLAAKSMQNELGPGEEMYEAKQGDMFITVGSISHVGREHIEYNVNTVPGFSGGPVVLLEPGSDCHMEVIAAHAGYSEDRGVNFGFLVAEKVEMYGASEACCSIL